MYVTQIITTSQFPDDVFLPTFWQHCIISVYNVSAAKKWVSPFRMNWAVRLSIARAHFSFQMSHAFEYSDIIFIFGGARDNLQKRLSLSG